MTAIILCKRTYNRQSFINSLKVNIMRVIKKYILAYSDLLPDISLIAEGDISRAQSASDIFTDD